MRSRLATRAASGKRVNLLERYDYPKLVDVGKLRPVVGAEFALKDIRRAHALSESGHSVGKIALYVGLP